MFARESDAVSPRLGDTNLASSGRTLNSSHALFCESVFPIGYPKGGKVSLRVCNLKVCQKVAWRNDSSSRLSAQENPRKGRSRQYEDIQFRRKNISKTSTIRTILQTEVKITALKVVAATATVTATTAVAQGVRTR